MARGGETTWGYECLGCGDCVTVATFDVIKINPTTMRPGVDEEKCTACGACSKICPRDIIEMRPKGPKNRRIYVQCVKKDKGAAAAKACAVACIGCGKCVKVCNFNAITLDNNLAYIDPKLCKLCRKCERECPKCSINAITLRPRKHKVAGATQSKEHTQVI